MKTATPGEKMDMTEPPSEAFDRQEVIVLMGELDNGQKQKFLPIICSGNGKFFNLGETTVPGMDKMEGASAGGETGEPKLSFGVPDRLHTNHPSGHPDTLTLSLPLAGLRGNWA